VKDLPAVITWSIPGFLLLVVLEIISYRLHRDDDELGYVPRDTATSLTMGLGSVLFDALWKVPIVAAYAVVYALTPLRVTDGALYTLPAALAAWPLVMLGQDFSYYWSHRAHHVVRVLWASHVVHHSSRRFNLSTALRQTWTGFTSWVFYLPMIALGVHPGVLAFASSLNLLYQFWIHTERIDRMPRWFEAVFNTPSHHRVHHASQGSYLDRNFAGILIVWDRWFGSFEPEGERPLYGLTKNIDTHNPLRVAFHEYAAIARDLRSARSARAWLGYLFGHPGWRPAAAGTLDAPEQPVQGLFTGRP
jgi:sterol desaturase/sphingolipid hydroxylase (fatty acid hydroxylase superfamily)